MDTRGPSVETLMPVERPKGSLAERLGHMPRPPPNEAETGVRYSTASQIVAAVNANTIPIAVSRKRMRETPWYSTFLLFSRDARSWYSTAVGCFP